MTLANRIAWLPLAAFALLWRARLAWAQTAPEPPPSQIDSETVLGFLVIAAGALGWWFWKRRHKDDGGANAPRQRQPLATAGPGGSDSGPRFVPDPPPTPPPRTASAPSGTTGSVFISYRRGDAGDVVGRIHDRLVDRFGKAHVFKDVDSIPLGVDFRRHLSDSVGKCRVFLAIISRGWLTQEDGQRRLDQPNDFVRIEMESALQRNIPVIPVLVQGAALPHEQDLPPSLREVAYRNATVVRADPDFQADIARLMDGIAYHLESTPADERRPR